MATRASSSRWKQAASAVIDAAALLAASPDSPPEQLYHFTDCQGLIGIFDDCELKSIGRENLNELLAVVRVTGDNQALQHLHALPHTQSFHARVTSRALSWLIGR